MSDQYIDNMYDQAEEDYERAIEKALDTCLGCDLFSLNDEGEGGVVACRMNADPINCGGPYYRMKAS